MPEEDQEQWEKFVSGPLSETNKKNTVDLVSFFLFLSYTYYSVVDLVLYKISGRVVETIPPEIDIYLLLIEESTS